MILAAALAYLVASLPTTLLVGAAAGIGDPRKAGTGNAGATNVALQAGAVAGLAVLVLDIAKGLLGVVLGNAYDGPATGAACGLAAVFGQVAPLFAGFRGGKGAATTLGAYLGLSPAIALAGLLLWAVYAFVVVRRFVAATVATLVSVAIALAVLGSQPYMVAFGAGAAALGLWAHRRDLRAWRSGEMPEVRLSLRASEGGRRRRS